MFAKQYIRTLFSAIALLLGTLSAQAQSRSVTGTVFNDDGKTPLVGCTIIVQGTTTGTTTEANGSYSIKVNGNDAVLVFQSLGYETQTIPVGSRTTINVTLKESATKIADVVVTALADSENDRKDGNQQRTFSEPCRDGTERPRQSIRRSAVYRSVSE